MENVKVFEFEQLGKKFRIELQYRRYMTAQTAWLDGDVLKMPAEPQESVSAKVFIDGKLKYETNRASAYWLRLSKDTKQMKGHTVKTVHDLQMAIIEPKTWDAYEKWIEEVIEEGTTPEVRTYLAQQQAAQDAEDLAEARRVVELAEEQKDIPSMEEARRRMKWWNDTYNEGGEGYVPEIIGKEQYERALATIERLTNEQRKDTENV